ncbi:pentatricopeptide repeat-containing protein At4g14190, chloroplastic [Camellia sinensis]|uniref:pentatricopeptide repeat-containing protein At4g14190, chloroplastic n=1 Tax=Camellia sinensis TaxID=4442 RepID=UPI001035AEAF|nr:pentatricopeptide repeat-containing protein At4g14190, chloroplastic [Camellia sinensis]
MSLTLDIYWKATLTLKSNFSKNKNKNKNNSLCKTLPIKTHTALTNPTSSTNPPSSPLHLKRNSHHHHHHQTPKHVNPRNNSRKQTTPFVDTFHENKDLKTLLEKLKKRGSDPLQILKDDGDWTKDHFWAVLRFLLESSRSKDVPQVFDWWKNIEKSRINLFNYEKIIGLLVEEGLIEEAISALKELMGHGLRPSSEIYNSIIHGFARKGRFKDALYYLKKMEEIDLKPDTETYDGLIQAYGKYRMYDEMDCCVKKMEVDGCPLDHITYNLLIQEFSRAGLLTRMEKLYQILISKRMDLQSSTLVAMLEAYANLGILGKMEKFYRKVLNSKTFLKDDLIRKLARVYILNHMFSRLDDLGRDLSSKTGKTDLVWCLHMLSHSFLLSRKGMYSVLQEMELENLPWNVTITNVILLTYVKMKDFKNLKLVLSEVAARHVKPDIVTIGVVFDAYKIGFDGMWALNMWRKMGFLDEAVEMNTDALVLTAFGKGHFLRSCEEIHSSLETQARERRIWTYQRLIDLMVKHNKRLCQLMGVEQS